MRRKMLRSLGVALVGGTVALTGSTALAQGPYPAFFFEDFNDGSDANDWLGEVALNASFGFLSTVDPVNGIGADSTTGVADGSFAWHFETNQGLAINPPERSAMFISITDGSGLFGSPANPRDLTIYENTLLSFDIRHGFPNGDPPAGVQKWDRYDVVIREVSNGAFNEARLPLSNYVTLGDTYQRVEIPLSDFCAAAGAVGGFPLDATIARAIEIQLTDPQNGPPEYYDGNGNFYHSVYVDNIRIGPDVTPIDATTKPYPEDLAITWENGANNNNWGGFANVNYQGASFNVGSTAGIGRPVSDGSGAPPAPGRAHFLQRASGDLVADMVDFYQMRYFLHPNGNPLLRDFTEYSHLSFDVRLPDIATDGPGGPPLADTVTTWAVGLQINNNAAIRGAVDINEHLTSGTVVDGQWRRVTIPMCAFLESDPSLTFDDLAAVTRFTIFVNFAAPGALPNTGPGRIGMYVDNINVHGPATEACGSTAVPAPLALEWTFEDGTAESNLGGANNVGGGRVTTGGFFQGFNGTPELPFPVQDIAGGVWTVTNTWDGTGFAFDFMNMEFGMGPDAAYDLSNFNRVRIRARNNAPSTDTNLYSVRIEGPGNTFTADRAVLDFSDVGEGAYKTFEIPLTAFTDGDSGTPADLQASNKVTIIGESPLDQEGLITVDFSIADIAFLQGASGNTVPVDFLADWEDNQTTYYLGNVPVSDSGIFGPITGFANTSGDYTISNVATGTRSVAGSRALKFAGTVNVPVGDNAFADLNLPVLPGGDPADISGFSTLTIRARKTASDSATFWSIRLEDATDVGTSFLHEEVALPLTTSFQTFEIPLSDFADGINDDPDNVNGGVPVDLGEVVNIVFTSNGPEGSFTADIEIDGVTLNQFATVNDWALY